MKLLSFIIPSYNCEKYLDKCLTSMLHPELLERLEIIVVNDGSQDGTQAIAERYVNAYMGGNASASGDTVSLLMNRMDEKGHKEFANQILRNQQKLGGKKQIPKEEVCYQLARYLRDLHIETIEDFQNFESQEILEIVIRAVNGLGDAGVNYLFMLAGDPNRCKPDVHIHHCIRDACGCDISNEECQTLFTDAIELLRNKYPNLTVRGLDGIIWRAYQVGR